MITIVTDLENCAGMQPEIMPGDTICIDPGERTGENGIYVIEYKGNQKFCRLTTTACGKWLIFLIRCTGRNSYRWKNWKC